MGSSSSIALSNSFACLHEQNYPGFSRLNAPFRYIDDIFKVYHISLESCIRSTIFDKHFYPGCTIDDTTINNREVEFCGLHIALDVHNGRMRFFCRPIDKGFTHLSSGLNMSSRLQAGITTGFCHRILKCTTSNVLQSQKKELFSDIYNKLLNASYNKEVVRRCIKKFRQRFVL